jgi:hypothetical protein
VFVPDLTPLDDEFEVDAEGGDEEVLDETESPEDESDEQSNEDEAAPLTRAEFEAYKQAPPWLNDLKTIQGRMSSIEARLAKSDDPAVKQELLRELRAESGKTAELYEEALLALDESAYADPSVKEKLTANLAQRRKEQDAAKLRQEILDEIKPKSETPAATDYRADTAVQVWENTWVEAITSDDLDPDSPEFADVWKGVSQYVAAKDFKGANAYMKDSVGKLRAEAEAVRKRQAAKAAGRKSPAPGNGEAGPLDESRSTAERTQYLISQGII